MNILRIRAYKPMRDGTYTHTRPKHQRVRGA